MIVVCLLSLAVGAANTGVVVAVTRGMGHYTPRLAAVFGVLCVVALTTATFSTSATVRLSHRALHDIQVLLSRRILAAPLVELETLGSHRLLVALTDDATAVATSTKNVATILRSAMTLVACLLYLAYQSVPVLGMVLVTVLATALLYRFVRSKAFPKVLAGRKALDGLFAELRAVVEGRKELKLHRGRREHHLAHSIPEAAQAVEKHAIPGETLFAWTVHGVRFIALLLVGAVVFIVGPADIISRTQVSASAVTILYLIGPLGELFGTLAQQARAMAALQRLDQVGISLDRAGKDTAVTETPAVSSWKQLELRGVTYTYPQQLDRGFTVGPIDMTIRPGELVFVVGGNGSGKSTLAKTLVGLYTPQSGQIFFDGEPIVDLNRESYRQRFSAVFADFFLFDDLRGLGIPSTDMHATASEYLAQLALTDKVQIKDDRFSTTALSQGQRRRLALLVAYLENRPIYLFDEWAAEQDPTFKGFFYKELLPKLRARGKAVIVVTHDDGYFDLADQTIKLSDGKLVPNAAV
jgi:putative pyoverdin transport system ATP-binding/permease protein